jgi:hypothetical protein
MAMNEAKKVEVTTKIEEITHKLQSLKSVWQTVVMTQRGISIEKA